MNSDEMGINKTVTSAFVLLLGDQTQLRAGKDGVSWPSLPPFASNVSRPHVVPLKTNMNNSANLNRTTNPWFPTNVKKFMNTRMGGKLSYRPQSSSDTYKMKVDSGYTMLETWGHALLGQYVGRMPSHSLIDEMMKKWNVHAKYRVEEDWLIFTFESEMDLEKVLIEGPYFILGRPLLVKRVPDKFSFHRRDIALVPLWVRLHGMGKRYWHPDILSDIGSFIGTPLYMDTVTDGRRRSAYARVLVEINLAAPIKKKITLEYDDGDSFDYEFFVENQPNFCKSCCSLGHNDIECLTMARTAPIRQVVPPKGISFAAAVKSAPQATVAMSAPATAASKPAPNVPLQGSSVGLQLMSTDVNMIVLGSVMGQSKNGPDLDIGKEVYLSKTNSEMEVPGGSGSVDKQVNDCGVEGNNEQEQVQQVSDDDDSWT